MIGRVLSGRYKVLSVVGEGGMSVVWRAQDMNTGKMVAIKVLRDEYREDESFVRRFEREALAASRMTHPNIANLLDVGTEADGTRFLVFEYVPGDTLKQVIQNSGAFAPAAAAQIIMRVLAAAQHAHQNGVIHRDIKPQNILLDKEGTVKVSDFGIARVVNSKTLSQDHDTVMGSVYYFSPEQASGALADEKSDVYSIGVVFYEMLTGVVPFTGDTPISIALKHAHETAKNPSLARPGVPPALDYVVLRAMEKRPRARYQSAADMLRDVRLALEDPDTILAARKEMEKREQEAQRQQQREGRARKRARAVRRAFVSVFTALLLALVALTAYFICERIILAGRDTVEVPDFYNMTETAAREMAEGELQLKVSVTQQDAPPSQKGLVIDQNIAAWSIVRPGDTLSLVVGWSAYDLTMPNLVGAAYATARETLDNLSLPLATSTYEASQAVAGTVIRQYPDHGTPINIGQTVDLVISGGMVTVPRLTGKDEAEAEQSVAASGLHIGERTYIATDDPLSVNKVIAQTPLANESVLQNSAVSITVGTPGELLIESTVTLDLSNIPQTGGTLTLKIEEPDGVQTTRVSTYVAEHSGQVQLPLYSDTEYTARYQVFFDDVLQYAGTITFVQ